MMMMMMMILKCVLCRSISSVGNIIVLLSILLPYYVFGVYLRWYYHPLSYMQVNHRPRGGG